MDRCLYASAGKITSGFACDAIDYINEVQPLSGSQLRLDANCAINFKSVGAGNKSYGNLQSRGLNC